jgi:hypothetical protein
VEHFQALTSGLELPLQGVGEAAAEVEAQLAEYNSRLTEAGMTLFHSFFRVAAGVILAAIVPALLMGTERRPTKEGNAGSHSG